MIRINPSSHKLDFVFVLSLFTVFAATALLLVLIGAKQYKTTADKMDENYEIRTASSYLFQKTRHYDSCSAIEVTSLGDCPALALHSRVSDVEYTDYVYYYNGWLRELLVSDASVYDLNSGSLIIELGGFSPSYANDSLLSLEIISTEGQSYDIFVDIKTQVKEDMYD